MLPRVLPPSRRARPHPAPAEVATSPGDSTTTRQGRIRPARPLHTAPLGIALLLVGMVLARPGGLLAADIAVNTTSDELNGDGACSLREAIQAANTDGAVSGCLAGSGADTITVPAGTYGLTLVGAKENGNATGDLDVLADVIITGAGAGLTVIDGNATDRELHVLAGTVVVEDVAFRNGRAAQGATGESCINETYCDKSGGAGEEGGGILTQAGSDLTLRRVVVEDNQAGAGGNAGNIDCPTAGAECRTFGGSGGNGGGVSGNGALTIEDSLLTQNRSGASGSPGTIIACGVSGDCFTSDGNEGDGGGVIITGASLDLRTTTVADNESLDWAGGVYCHHNSSCTIQDSTIVGNRAAARGGGLTGIGTNTTVTGVNTTVSANQASGPGGGVSLFSGTMDLDFVTIAGNSAGTSGGGVERASFGALTMRNSIVADNTNPSSPNCSGAIVSGGYNHVENLIGCGMALGAGDVAGSDPNLLPLTDNGGPTETQALPDSSIAVDAIPAGINGCGSTIATDQRSAARPMDGDRSGTVACDKGAFELVPPILGGGGKASDCLVEWIVEGAASFVAGGVPSTKQSCVDGDPACDHDSVAGQCTFEVALCLNVNDERLANGQGTLLCVPSDVASIDVAKSPALAGPLASLGGTAAGACKKGLKGASCQTDADCDTTPGSGNGLCKGRVVTYAPPLGAVVCTDRFQVPVTLGVTQQGLPKKTTTKLKLGAQSAPVGDEKPLKDTDAVKLTCLPG
jgi:CSLREA domain-containing protein